MVNSIKAFIFLSLTLFALSCQAGEVRDAPQSPVNPTAVKPQKYPKVVLYSTSWCPHCKEAKEYFTRNSIPFINKDVEIDSAAMDELTNKYKSQGVPVIVIGDDKVILKGFNKEKFEKAVNELPVK
ncbi:MAG: YruB family glutaredoxin-like [Geobacteraceae bacterium]|nr:MAG: YruB family glutaredoxin-like [Geobacteraceae bacterium]